MLIDIKDCLNVWHTVISGAMTSLSLNGVVKMTGEVCPAYGHRSMIYRNTPLKAMYRVRINAHFILNLYIFKSFICILILRTNEYLRIYAQDFCS